MPIRFACDHCGGVLSIARRKAYALVDCPKCGCKQVVPNESRGEFAEVEAKPMAKNSDLSSAVAVALVDPPVRERPLFERDDIENLLTNHAKKITPIPTITPSSIPTPPISVADVASGVELMAVGSDVLLRKNQLTLVIVLAGLAALFLFGLGFLAGKYS